MASRRAAAVDAAPAPAPADVVPVVAAPVTASAEVRRPERPGEPVVAPPPVTPTVPGPVAAMGAPALDAPAFKLPSALRILQESATTKPPQGTDR